MRSRMRWGFGSYVRDLEKILRTRNDIERGRKAAFGRYSRTYVYEDEPEVDHVERIRFPCQWFGQDIELLELKVGVYWAMVGIEKSCEQMFPERSPSEDGPRIHRTDVYCGHLSIGEFLSHVERPVPSERRILGHRYKRRKGR
jgi:hypothetical protein